MPRLDVTFKRGPIPKERGPIPEIRKHWRTFCLKLKSAYENADHKTRILEAPLWQITEDLVHKESFNADIIFIPHKMKLNWSLDDRVYYYMQMVVPNIFSIDSQGWCASSSTWPIGSEKAMHIANSPHDPFSIFRQRINNNISKFDQPKTLDISLPTEYILFPCQIPHDETITYHSDVSVQDSLQALIESLSLHPGYSLIIKSHPVNLSAMVDLKKIYQNYKEMNNSLSERIYWVDNIGIHQLLENCLAVFTVNSGVGFEALLHYKRVFTFGNADYLNASTKIIFGGNKRNCVKAISRHLSLLSSSPIDKNKIQNFVNNWYHSHYDVLDDNTFEKAPKLKNNS